MSLEIKSEKLIFANPAELIAYVKTIKDEKDLIPILDFVDTKKEDANFLSGILAIMQGEYQSIDLKQPTRDFYGEIRRAIQGLTRLSRGALAYLEKGKMPTQYTETRISNKKKSFPK